MKFILQENKFILSETTKFILEERFILAEAAKEEVATTEKWLELLLKNIGESATAYTKVSKYLKDTLDTGPLAPKSVSDNGKILQDIETAAKALARNIQLFDSATSDKKKELVPIYTAIAAYKTNLDAAHNNTSISKNYKGQLQKAIKFLEDLAKQLPQNDAAAGNFSDKNFTKLLKQIQQLPKFLEKITTLLTTAFDTSADQNLQTKLKAFQQLCIEGAGDRAGQGLLKDSKKFKLPATKAKSTTAEILKLFSDSTLKDYQSKIAKALKAAQELEDYPGAEKVLANFDKYYAQVELVITSFKQIRESAVYADLEKLHAEDPKAKTIEDIDWKSKLAGSRNKLAVIEEFIYLNWNKEKHAEVLKIKDTLLKECEAYGFISNPFVNFISDVYLVYKFSPEVYNAIHNLVVDRILSIEDIRGRGQMGLANLIFSPNLYQKSVGEIQLYLKKQANLLKAPLKDARFTNNAAMTYYALYERAVPEEAESNVKIPAKDRPPTTDIKIRPMNKVEEFESKWTGAVSSTEVAAPKKSPSIEILLNQISGEEEAIKVITAMVLKFSSTKKIADKANTCKEVQDLLTKTTTPATLAKLVASIENKFNIANITASNALNLVESILASDKFKLTKV